MADGDENDEIASIFVHFSRLKPRHGLQDARDGAFHPLRYVYTRRHKRARLGLPVRF